MRQPAADSAKFVLVALVVIGHLIEACRSGYPQLEAAYRFLYLFHVPALAYVSGLFARAEFGVRDGQRWLATLILPLLVFQLLYLGFIAAISDRPFAFRVATPYWLLWYLASLACWRVLLPALMSLRRPLLVTAVLAVAVGWASDVGYAWSASRTLVFLPFFVAGHVYGLPRPRRALPILALLALAVAAWYLRPVPARSFYGSTAFASHWDALVRSGLLAAGALGTWAVLSLMPQRAGLSARLGEHSLSAYLLHGFVVKALPITGLALPWAASGRLIACVGGGLALSVLLAWLGRWLRPLMDYRWLLARREAAAAAAGEVQAR